MKTVTLVTSARRWKRLVKASQSGGRYIPAVTVSLRGKDARKDGSVNVTGTLEDVMWVAPFLGGKFV